MGIARLDIGRTVWTEQRGIKMTDSYRKKYALLPLDVVKFKEPTEGDICRFCGCGIAQHTKNELTICLAGMSSYNVDDAGVKHWQNRLEESA